MAGLYTPSGLTPNTFKNIQLGAGAFFVDVDLSGIDVDNEGYANKTAAELGEMLDAAKSAGKSLGATSGGGTFNAVPEMEQLEVDGMTYPVIGSTVMYSWEVTLATTVKEVTAKNIKRFLATMETLPDGITVSSTLTPGHYIPNLIWAGVLISGEIALIKLDNVINTEGMAMTIADRGGASIPVSFRAHQADLLTMQYAPFRMMFFKTEITLPGLTDAQKMAADKAVVMAGSFEIPLSYQTNQGTMTAWVQSAVENIIQYTNAVVEFYMGEYTVTLSIGSIPNEVFTINVTEAV
jgi:hypothetical protein